MALTTNQNSMNNSISQVNKQNYQNPPPGHFTSSGFTALESPASTHQKTTNSTQNQHRKTMGKITSKKAESSGGLALLTQGLNIKGASQTLGERTAAVLNQATSNGVTSSNT